MRDIPEKFKGVSFFLQRVFFSGSRSPNQDLFGLQLEILSTSLGLDQSSPDFQCSTSTEFGNFLIIFQLLIGNDLETREITAVIKLDETESLGSPAGSHPTPEVDFPVEKTLSEICDSIGFRLTDCHFESVSDGGTKNGKKCITSSHSNEKKA